MDQKYTPKKSGNQENCMKQKKEEGETRTENKRETGKKKIGREEKNKTNPTPPPPKKKSRDSEEKAMKEKKKKKREKQEKWKKERT